jgi:hypothetical protein
MNCDVLQSSRLIQGCVWFVHPRSRDIGRVRGVYVNVLGFDVVLEGATRTVRAAPRPYSIAAWVMAVHYRRLPWVLVTNW